MWYVFITPPSALFSIAARRCTEPSLACLTVPQTVDLTATVYDVVSLRIQAEDVRPGVRVQYSKLATVQRKFYLITGCPNWLASHNIRPTSLTVLSSLLAVLRYFRICSVEAFNYYWFLVLDKFTLMRAMVNLS